MFSARQPAFPGVIPPVVTPLDEHHDVDVDSLARLVEHLLDAGVHGLFAIGSSGETVFLTDRQRDVALETIIGVNAGRVPVLAGCIEPATTRVIERARRSLQLGADAIVAAAPFYTRTHPTEIDRHFRAIRSAVDLALLAYDIPVSVQVKLGTDILLGLAADGVLDGVKDSSGDDVAFRQLMLGAARLPSFSGLTGHEVVADGSLLSGADGIVPGLGNVDPAGYVRMFEAARRGDWASVKAEQDRLAVLFEIVDVADPQRSGGSTKGVGAFKTALVELGVISGNAVSLPLRKLDDSEARTIRKSLEEAGLR